MTKIKGYLSKNTNRSTNSRATRINTRLFLSSNVEQVDRTNVKRVTPSLVLNKILDNLNKAVHHLILARRYPLAAADGMDYEGLVNLDKSTTPVSFNGKVYVGKNYLSASYSQDNKSDLEHKQALAAFLQNQERLRKENEIKLTAELLNNPYNPIGWIPGLRSVVNTGADLNYFRTYNTAFTPYTTDAAFSTAGDAITLGFGLGPFKNYAGSYVGTVAGGLIGELFDNPLLGLIIGGITGGFSPLIYNVTADAYQRGKQAYNTYRLSRLLNLSVKNWDGTVGSEYFNSPYNWYRATEFPEIQGIQEAGKNVTTRDLDPTTSLIGNWRNFILENKLKPGTGNNEGYWIVPRKKTISLSKMGLAHGNTSLAAKGLIWQGTYARSGTFPKYTLEGEAPVEVFRGFNPATGTDSRTNFVKVPWEDVPFGARIGFHTGEMPLEGLRAFRELPNGRYLYEGPVLPDITIRLNNYPYSSKRVSYLFYERPSKLTDAERAGIPRGERNNTSKPLTDFGLMEVIDNVYLASPSLTNYIGGGGESWVYSDLDRIYKVMRSPLVGLSGYNNFNLNGFSKERIGDFIRLYINPRNRHPIFEPIQFEGIVHLDDLVFPVVSLRRLTAFPSEIPGELVRKARELFQQLMNKYDYKQVSDLLGGFGRGYRNNLGTIGDVSFKNLGYTPEGELRMFDMLAEKNGGKLNRRQR